MQFDVPLPARRLVLSALAGRRGEKLLFAGVDLALRPGEIGELRGQNGIGKTTLLMIVAGIIRPAGGSVAIEGGDAELRPELDMAYLAHRAAIKPRLTVLENLQFWVSLYGGHADFDASLDAVGLLPIATLDAGHLSAGQTRRLTLARLLLANRPVWLLDEPTSSLDAQGETLVATLIDAHLDRGGIVLAATHHDLQLQHTARVVRLVRPEVAA